MAGIVADNMDMPPNLRPATGLDCCESCMHSDDVYSSTSDMMRCGLFDADVIFDQICDRWIED